MELACPHSINVVSKATDQDHNTPIHSGNFIENVIFMAQLISYLAMHATIVFQDCNIYPRLPMQGHFNTIITQGIMDPNQNTGTSIHNCSIRAAKDWASSDGITKTYLRRPWKTYSRTVYIQSFMDSLIDPLDWHEWSGTFALTTLYCTCRI